MRTGQRFEHEVSRTLSRCGFQPLGNDVDVHGTELDLMVANQWGGRTLVECKGGKRGLRSADMVKRLVGTALYVNVVAPDFGPILPVTTYLPRAGTVADKMVRVAVRQGLIFQPETIETLERSLNHWARQDWMVRNHTTIFMEDRIPLDTLRQLQVR